MATGTAEGPHTFGGPETWPTPVRLEERKVIEIRRPERDAMVRTGSDGQKPGRHMGRWKRGGIETNGGPKEMPGFPRARLARSLAGTCAVGNAERFTQTPARMKCLIKRPRAKTM